MADFETRVEGLTGLTVSTHFTTAELTDYLKDGVIDVTNRCIALNPGDAKKFQEVTAAQTSQGANLNGAKILSVVRESGVTNQWEECKYIHPGKQYSVTDTSSLDYASKFHPVYTILEDSKINVYPAPGASPNSYKVYYVNNEPQNGDGGALAYNSSDLKSFPNDKVYLVVLYAGIACMRNVMASLHGNTDITTALTAVNTELDETQDVCDLINTQVDSAIAELAEAATLVDGNIDTAVAAITTALSRVNTAVQLANTEFDLVNGEVDLANQFVDDEDTEVASGYIQTAQGYSNAGKNYLDEAQASLQEAQGFVAEVNARTGHVNAQVGVAQGYIAAAQGYASELQSKIGISGGYLQEAQGRMANLAQEYKWYEGRLKELKQEYEMAFERMKPPQQAGARS
tara:strand:+ start:421 stop:1623 length:1203 start_codon:yes stop_codon:yes gene_type:complete